MKPNIQSTKCFFHSLREAEARCPECSHFYCRECVTFFDGKYVCSSCLSKNSQKVKPGRKKLIKKFLSFYMYPFCFFLIWIVFYLVGYRLMQVWADTHSQNFWEETEK